MKMRIAAIVGAALALTLSLTPASAAELTGRLWRPLVLVDGKVAPRQEIRFERGTVTGSDGCNRFRGSYSAPAPHRVRVRMRGMASTMMACPPAIMRSSRSFMSALENARGWRIERGRLYLTDRRGRTVAVFRR